MLQFLKLKKYFSIIILIINFNIGVSYAQIEIKFPAERSVFQRNNNNIGNVHISGILNQDADKVEGRLLPINSGQGTPTDWKSIDTNIDGLSFTGLIEGNGGWYRLEIRSIKNNSILETTLVDKVGIGEVFVIAGQSNASGFGENPNSLPATDERVIAYEPSYPSFIPGLDTPFPDILPYDKFTNISAKTNIGPFGFSSYCYGELGDKLVKKLNVPVLFFNCGVPGTSSENWVSSIYGKETYHILTKAKYQQWTPFHPLKKTISTIINLYGVRTILWHQGESDSIGNITENTYYENLKTVIIELRKNIGSNIPWVVSRVSRYFGIVNPTIISAQNKIISNIENVWPGPSTDGIQPNRYDEAHFQNNSTVKGLSELAEAWNQSLTNNFFNSSLPILGKGIVEIKYACLNQSEVNLKFENVYQSYIWNNGSTSSQIKTASGEFYAILKDGYSNSVYSSKLNIANVYPKDVPILSTPNGLIACTNKSVQIQASVSKYSVNWNNGIIGNTISASKQGPYFSAFRSDQGCLSKTSNQIFPQFVDPPNKPNIEFINGDGYECQGNNIQLKVNNTSNYQVLWSLGQKENEIKITSIQKIPITVTLYSNFDCPSPNSDSVKYKFLEIPSTPIIEKSGPFSVTSKTGEIVQRFDLFFNNKFLSSQTTNDFLVNGDGLYSIQSIKTFITPKRLLECKSGLSTQLFVTKNEHLYGLSVYPNPVIDRFVYVASDKELKNIKLSLLNSIGQEITEYAFTSISHPQLINLDNSISAGKYYLKLEYGGLSRTFPLFVK